MRKITNLLILFILCGGVFSQVTVANDGSAALEGLDVLELETLLGDLKQREHKMREELEEIERQLRELDIMYEEINRQLLEVNN